MDGGRELVSRQKEKMERSTVTVCLSVPDEDTRSLHHPPPFYMLVNPPPPPSCCHPITGEEKNQGFEDKCGL